MGNHYAFELGQDGQGCMNSLTPGTYTIALSTDPPAEPATLPIPPTLIASYTFSIESIPTPTPTEIPPTPTPTEIPPTPTPTTIPTPTSFLAQQTVPTTYTTESEGLSCTPDNPNDLLVEDDVNVTYTCNLADDARYFTCFDNSEYADGSIYVGLDKQYLIGAVDSFTFTANGDFTTDTDFYLYNGANIVRYMGSITAGTDVTYTYTASNADLGGFFTAQRLHFTNSTCGWGVYAKPRSGGTASFDSASTSFRVTGSSNGEPLGPQDSYNSDFKFGDFMADFKNFFSISAVDEDIFSDFLLNLENKVPFAYIFSLLDIDTTNVAESPIPTFDIPILGFTTYQWTAPQFLIDSVDDFKAVLSIVVWASFVVYLILLPRRLSSA